jgi:hypothetical protein
MTGGRTLAAVTAACSVALLLPLTWPLLTGRVFVYNDLAWFHLPMRHLYQQALRAGDSVLWTPSILAGLYLHGEGQVGLLHPLHWLLYRLLSLQAAFNLELIANYVAAFGGMSWFLRRLRFSPASALFGAMLFAFSGFNLLHHHHINMIAVVAHMPWLLGAADVVIAGERSRARGAAFAAIALIVASECLLGFPQGIWWNVVTLAAFAAYRAGETGRWRRLLPCAAAVTIGVVIGGIQLIPSADAAAHSIRLMLSREFALTYSLHPLNLFQLWSPYVFEYGVYGRLDYPWFHELGIYSGAILPVALIWVWIRRGALSARRSLITAATAFAALNLVLALGRHGGVDVLLTYLPILESLRAPVRYFVLVQFSLAILAAVTIDDLIAIADGHRAVPSGRLPILWMPAVLSVGTLVLFNARLLPYGTQTFASAQAAAPGVAFVVGVTLLVFLAARRVRWALPALAVVTMADLGVWGIGFIYREPPRGIGSLTQAVTAPPIGTADSYTSAPSEGPYRGDLLVMKGYRLTSGYVALYPATRDPLDSAIFRRLSGTRSMITPHGVRLPVEGSVERARLLDDQGEESSGAARVAVDRPGYIAVHVEAPAPRILALTERFHDGWSATVDGRPLRMVPVEGDFLGCLVDAGIQRVELRFMPRSFVQGAAASAAGVLLLAAGVIIMMRR